MILRIIYEIIYVKDVHKNDIYDTKKHLMNLLMVIN